MPFKQIKRIGAPVGNDDWVLFNNTGAAIAVGDVVAITIGETLNTAVAVATANLDTILAIALTACANNATLTFRACVQGIATTTIPASTAAGGLLMAANAATTLTTYVTDTKAANKAVAISLDTIGSGGAASGKVLFDGMAWSGFGRVT